ncbi:biotin/lipoyl-containing protein [Marinobacter metalliresistant]|uniref:Carboxyltransferase domain-containing protein n=1 Tax=Marinobacter metalliresistant TaxID=2961995 RepID=A0ABZ2W6G4_9GAMM
MSATLDNKPVEFWKPITVKAGQVNLPACTTTAPTHDPAPAAPADPDLIPDYPDHWEIGVLYGPHGAPDFFTEASIEKFFEQDWEVHYNSNRLGIRLNGPKPEFTRADGGEAGLHPSNIHDCEYAIGSINFTGDMPVILTKDGPSLGGFVCPVTIAKAELWKVGQVKPGDTIRFVSIENDTAVKLSERQELAIKSLMAPPAVDLAKPDLAPLNGLSATILAHLEETDGRPEVSYRQAGDQYILLEYGPNVMDLGFRLRIHALMEAIADVQPAGLLELSPGVRSLQLRYDARILPQHALMEYLLDLEATLPPTDELKVRSRVIHLPMAFEDSATLEAVDKYRQSVRDTAPWLPNNVDFMQRINGLPSREAVRDILFSARYLVLGLGDVYLGTPWLLRFFDQVCYYPVTEAELDEMRDQFRAGQLTVKIEEETFDLKSHQAFLDANAGSIADFRKMQQAAYAKEIARWKDNETDELDRLAKAPPKADLSGLEKFGELVSAEIAGNIWKCLVKPGDTVAEGDPLMIVEAMKMEFEVNATLAGEISAMHVQPGKAVTPGEPLLSIKI